MVQFNITNTLPDTILEQVSVLMTAPEGLTEDFIIPIPSLSSNEPGVIYVSYSRDDPTSFALGSASCVLKFVSKEVDPTSGEPEEEGYEDEYQIEEVDVGAGDYIVPSYATFASEWDRLRSAATATETFNLSALESLKGAWRHLASASRAALMLLACYRPRTAACTSLVELLNMEPLGGTADPSSTSVHTLQLSGLVAGGGGKVLARCRMAYQAGQGVTLELSARAERQEACDLVMAAIA